ncbi:MAG: GNAT family N-acetyltransferase [Defluviitaleaceae bacterium]|nr:GNAT family N-acetyltransferase [Defluviitaleaceae bacterium]
MAYYKRIACEKVYLSPICMDDADTFTRWINDPDVNYFLTFYSKTISFEKEKELLDVIAKSGNHFSIVAQETDELLGNCGFFSIDETNRAAEMGIFIGNKEQWGKGYGTCATQLLLKYGFENRNFHNICLKVFSFNERAIACYEKVGFKKQGIRREAIIRGNKKYDEIYMDILADEYWSIYG